MATECVQCRLPFTIEDRDLEFYSRVSPHIFGVQHLIPPPTHCPECRFRRRMAWRNERTLYRTNCALTGRSIVSQFAPDSPLKVCDRRAWLGVDNTQFGREFDFTRPFFEQFAELYRDTYKANVMQSGEMVNSEYTHFTGWLKNCYLVFDVGKSEDCQYGSVIAYSKNCFDLTFSYRSELCYDCYKVDECYRLFWSSFCKHCSDSAFLFDCIGCKSCLGCTNLRHKEYFVLNEEVGKEVFAQVWQRYINGSYRALNECRGRFQEILRATPRRPTFNIQAERCTGDNLLSCENVLDSYDCVGSRNVRYCYNVIYGTENCYDVSTFGESMEQCYELSGCGGALEKSGISNIFFSVYIFYGGYNILYSMNCHEHSRELFGCCDLRHMECCVLNRQYRPAEYGKLVERIVHHMRDTGEWGEFFPIRYSPFSYDESLAQEFFPLSRNEALQLGARWSGQDSRVKSGTVAVDAADLPDSHLGSDPSQLTVRCEVTGKPFRFTASEIEFYRENAIPLPRRHPEERERNRRARANPRRLNRRGCAACGTEILTTYTPHDGTQVLCEGCYNGRVY